MAIPLTGNGSLFGTLGPIFAAQRTANGFRGETAPDPANASWGSGGQGIKCMEDAQQDIFDQLKASVNLQSLSQTLFPVVASARSQMTSYAEGLQRLAQQVLVSLVTADATLPDSTPTTCLEELIRQMLNSSDSVDASSVSAAIAAASGNTGDAVMVVSVKGKDGTNRENVFPETLLVKIATDGQQGGGGTAGREQVRVSGDVLLNRFDPLYPSGSGVSITFQLTDPSENAGQNVLYNSEDFFSAANTLSHWTAAVGTAGTDIQSVTASGNKVRSDYALSFVGDGATLSEIHQPFSDGTNGTSKQLAPNTMYAVNVWAKKSATGVVNGNLTLRLIDSSNATISDDAGNPCNLTFNVNTSISNSTFVSCNGTFITPKVMPSSYKLSLGLTTALTANATLYLDELAMAEMRELYTEGPSIMGFQGKTNVIRNDYWTLTISNNLAGMFQTDFDRNFDMKSKRLQLPSDSGGNETISDSLIA